MSLIDKVAILFGAGMLASGYAPLFADEQMKLVIISRGDSSDKLADSINGRAGSEVISMHADASDFDQVGKIYDDTMNKFKRIDVVVNGSGGNRPEAVVSSLDAFIGMDPSVAEAMIASNYLSKHYSLQHFAKVLQKAGYQGSVVNITSMSGLMPLTKVIPYSAAFAAVENLTRSIAYLYGHYGLGRVNNIAVGFIKAEQNRILLENLDRTDTERAKEIKAATSQHRFLTSKEIAPSVLYLADNEKSGAINGITLRVDGGFGIVSLPQTGYASRDSSGVSK